MFKMLKEIQKGLEIVRQRDHLKKKEWADSSTNAEMLEIKNLDIKLKK